MVKALTVQQPWAWAIFHGKKVENRTQAWSYRGPLAIHAGNQWSEQGEQSGLVRRAFWEIGPQWNGGKLPHWQFPMGVIVGTVDLVDVHPAAGCCAPWGEQRTGVLEPRRRIVHLVLKNPRSLPEPIPCRGALGLWTPPADVVERLAVTA